jgi:YD repeat-containing protein
MLGWLFLLACAPPSPSADEASAARSAGPTATVSPVSRPEFLGLGAWKGPGPECRLYIDGAFSSRTTLDAAGRPTMREHVNGYREHWYRTLRADGTVERLTVRVSRPGEASVLWLEEEFDDRGRKVQSRDGGGHVSAWTYDAEGRVTSARTESGLVEHRTWEYDELGRILGETWTQCCEPRTESGGTRYEWEEGRLVSEESYYRELYGSSWSGTRWVRHHGTGLPELGEVVQEDGTVTAQIEWVYDDDGHPLQYVHQDRVQRWEWDGDHLVLARTWYQGALGEWREYVWDDDGRLTMQITGWGEDSAGFVETWEWDADGEYIGGTQLGNEWTATGACPNRLFAPIRALSLVPSPLPIAPTAPLPYGEAE